MPTIQVWVPENEADSFTAMLKELRDFYDYMFNADFGDRAYQVGPFGGRRRRVRRKRINNSLVIREAVKFLYDDSARKEEQRRNDQIKNPARATTTKREGEYEERTVAKGMTFRRYKSTEKKDDKPKDNTTRWGPAFKHKKEWGERQE